MVEAMKITREMAKNREKKVDAIITKINKDIKREIDRGGNCCYFDCSKSSPFYEEVRMRYELNGFTIRPTGYIGGVWQLTEDIVW